MADNYGHTAAMKVLEQQGEIGKPLQASLDLGSDDQPCESTDQAGSPKKRGRPQGARNRRTADVVAEVQARFTDPIVQLMQIGSWTWDEARVCGVKKADYVKTRISALTAALPYIHARKVEAKIESQGDFKIVLGDFQGALEDDQPRIVDVIDINDLDNSIGQVLEGQQLEASAKNQADQPDTGEESDD